MAVMSIKNINMEIETHTTSYGPGFNSKPNRITEMTYHKKEIVKQMKRIGVERFIENCKDEVESSLKAIWSELGEEKHCAKCQKIINVKR